MEKIILVISIVNFIFLIYMFSKIRRIHLFCWKIKDQISDETVQIIRNIESLDSLYRDLKLKRSLPPTMGFAGSPDFLRLITNYASNENVNTILECSSGLSTIVLAQAFKIKGKGHVYSLENDAVYADITRKNLREFGLENWATIITAPLKDYEIKGQKYSWYDIENKMPEVKFDGLSIDGPPWSVAQNARYPAGPLLFGYLEENAHVFLDDYDREDEQRAVECWLEENPQYSLLKHRFMKGCAELVKKA